MILHSINESVVEDAAPNWFGELGYAIGHDSQIVTLRDMLLFSGNFVDVGAEATEVIA